MEKVEKVLSDLLLNNPDFKEKEENRLKFEKRKQQIAILLESELPKKREEIYKKFNIFFDEN